MELYQAYADFHDMMDLFEALLSGAAKEILGTYQMHWMGEDVDLTPGWPRMTMAEAVRKYLGVDFMSVTTDAEAKRWLLRWAWNWGRKRTTPGAISLYECFDQKVEEKLVQPTFITMHPVDVSPLAKRSPKDPRLTERFELFICRSEMGNAFSELNDPIDQKGPFPEAGGDAGAWRRRGWYDGYRLYHSPGIWSAPHRWLRHRNRPVCHALTGQDSVREVILFPTMKPIGGKRPVKSRVSGNSNLIRQQFLHQ